MVCYFGLARTLALAFMHSGVTRDAALVVAELACDAALVVAELACDAALVVADACTRRSPQLYPRL